MEDSRIQKENISEIIGELIEKGNRTVLKTVLVDLHPADIAEAMIRLDKEENWIIFQQLELDTAAEVIIELDALFRQGILQQLDEQKLVEIIGAMDSDDAADVIGELDDETAQKVLSAMPWKEFREVKTLLLHDEETAGGIMALEIVAVVEHNTAQEALDVLRRKAEEVDDVYNVYGVDNAGVLKGILSLKDLVLAGSWV